MIILAIFDSYKAQNKKDNDTTNSTNFMIIINVNVIIIL